ncbi:MAG: tRNA (adenosine(37)-N6)-threonylcarbamoyltransferase complex ATPase subunit type 1 TsaE [Oscillospiraceae bacterium]|nr:tRNA (adenosine(37)-N6)-threonylcarbamoyltransferase complex ATPase subunit type 1 TsaE [Oscillospiraceae bacterium]
MREIITHSVQETEAVGRALAGELSPGDLIAFVGGMGAGKTAFVRGLAVGLGVKGEVSSPTYAIVNEYRGNPPLYHFDMYRVESEDDLYTTGFYDYMEEGKGILAVEWSENITEFLPEYTIYITLIPLSEKERKIQISGGERF